MQPFSEYGDTDRASKEIGCSASFLNKARVTGDGPPYIKLGKSVRYHIPTLREWLKSRTYQSTSQHTRKAS